MHPYEKKYSRYKQLVEKRLVAVTQKRKPASLFEPIAYTLNGGGKRIRPVLTMLACESVHGKITTAISAASAIEILHNFTLIHDDIMDNADMRRGRNSVHKQFDSNTALLAGDTMVALAYEELLKTKTSSLQLLHTVFTNGFRNVCEGQQLDKECQGNNNISLDDYFAMIEKKTATLFSTATTMGAIIGNDNSREINALKKFGAYLGIAFQIQDDYLDVYATDIEFGKRSGGDIAEGKKTFLTLRALQKLSGTKKNIFLALLRTAQQQHNKKEFALYFSEIKTTMNALHIPEDTHKEITHWTNRSIKALAPLQHTEAKNMLTQISLQLVERTF